MSAFLGVYFISGIIGRLFKKKTGKMLNIQDKELNISDKHQKRVLTSALSVNHILATGGEDKIIVLWDLQSGQMIGELIGHQGTVKTLTFNPSGQMLASGADDGSIRLWDVSNLQEINTLTEHGHVINDLKFNSMGTKFASASSNGHIVLWDAHTYERLAVYKQEYSGGIYSISFSMDDELLASVDQSGTVSIWDNSDNQLWVSIDNLPAKINCLAFHPFEPLLALAGDDNQIYMYDIYQKKIVQELEYGHITPVTAVTFSPDGSILVSGAGDEVINFWNYESGKVLGYFEGTISDILHLEFNQSKQQFFPDSQFYLSVLSEFQYLRFTTPKLHLLGIL